MASALYWWRWKLQNNSFCPSLPQHNDLTLHQQFPGDQWWKQQSCPRLPQCNNFDQSSDPEVRLSAVTVIWLSVPHAVCVEKKQNKTLNYKNVGKRHQLIFRFSVRQADYCCGIWGCNTLSGTVVAIIYPNVIIIMGSQHTTVVVSEIYTNLEWHSSSRYLGTLLL